MKKAVRIMALILAFACLFSGTAFAEQPEETAEESVVLHVQLEYDVQVDNDNYASLFPEIDIALVESLLKFTNGDVYMDIWLADTAENAGEKAVAALENNPYVVRASTKEFFGAFVGAVIYYPKDGDIDRDERLTNADLIGVTRYIIGINDVGAACINRGDIDNNGTITNTDLIAVARMIVA